MIRCQFEDGTRVILRHICVNAIVVRNGKVLLGKRGKYKGKKILESGKWGLLGGFLERDETLKECLKREVLEESGWQIDELWLFRINDNPRRPAEDRQNVDIIFITKAVRKVGASNEEVASLKWFDLNRLPPKEKIAFDHAENLELYSRYLKEKFNFPIWGRSERGKDKRLFFVKRTN